MSKRQILTVTVHGLIAWSPVGKIREDRYFTSENTELFTQWLSTKQGVEFHLIADIVDEGFHLEKLPEVRVYERRSLLKRKLRQRFPDTSLSLAHTITQVTEKQRRKSVLLSALTESTRLKPWLDILQAHDACLVGIYTPSLLLPHLLGKAEPQQLLVTFGRSGMRQSLLQNGVVIFSRLFPIESQSAVIAILHAETSRLQQYLIGQGLLESSVQLPVHCFIDAEHSSVLKQHCPDSTTLTFQYADMCTLSSHVHSKNLPERFTVDDLFVQLLIKHPPRLRFGNRSTLKYYAADQWQHPLKICTATALLCAMLIVPISLLSVHESRVREATARLALSKSQSQQDLLDAALSTRGTNIEVLQSISAQWHDIKRRSSSLIPSLQIVSRTLPAGLELQRLEWRHDPNDQSIHMDLLLHGVPSSNRAEIGDIAEQFTAALRNSPTDEAQLDMPAIDQTGQEESGQLIRIHYQSRPNS
ncbi:MAG TPA: hypothetical protein VL550_09295 [Rhodocyclaceae bacterium]|jgi:hypothetical protein|nr:hypothetical protein [Rhodocyclaceae bacterium]